ncbi:MAG: FAD-dependent oxidoreductase [Gammaproteobacteria bacterium]|nr:FAD-dependent oxidoreductase [Gammaproteobacteria bacterium]MCP5137736.1 FAD-dependent oxidoreductase [Gammaproteobacteria bacterium]
MSSDIDYKDAGSILAPLKNLRFFAREPVTEPLGPRPAAENYRGFHVNDWELCIGCSTCQKVCDNAAISMIHIPGLPNDPVKGVRDHRPAIDYGRCCWCGLCVDICPTGSISLTREYVHTCTEPELDSYFVLPDPNGMHKTHFPKGWSKTEQNDLLDHDRQPMAEMAPEARIGDFAEIVAGYTDQQALLEASRCVQCGMCHDACPTQMHAPDYIRAIWQGNVELAVEEIYRTNPFAHVCGRVCTHKCEDACSIGRRGTPVAIRWLKRYAMDALAPAKVKKIAAKGKSRKKSGRKIAIVGAGPAGMTAAFDLIKQGHAVTVFEALDQAGGMTRYGIPYYRLPSESLQRDIDIIVSLGVEMRYRTRVGVDVSMAELEQEYDAVVLALGLQLGRSTRIPGSDHVQVRAAVDLLRRIAAGESLAVPDKVVVIGGGNVAMDIARTLARLQKQQHGVVGMTVCALEDFAHFLADPEEVRESGEEGIEIIDARGPRHCVVNDDGTLGGLCTWKVLSIFDEQHRFAPKFDESDERIHEAGMVVESIGQMTDTGLLGDELTEALEWNRGRMKVDAFGRTSLPWLWAAGDCVNGPDVVHAVADGHRVATSINEYLTQEVAA